MNNIFTTERPLVAVLMSTYNGARYLNEQIDSILGQEGVDVLLFVRDDGSSDGSLDIFNKYPVKLIKGSNLGCEGSFMELLRMSVEADFYAFADQDDVWFPNKLQESVRAIKDSESPCLYCANQIITDGNLHPIRWMIKRNEYVKWQRNMEQNYLSNRHGCTQVWNKQLHTILRSLSNKIDYIPAHDTWVNVVARCVGKVILGLEPLQFYRVHSTNTGGLASSRFERFKKGVKLYWIRDCHRDLYAKTCEDNLMEYQTFLEGWKYIHDVAHYRESLTKRFKVAFSRQIWHGSIGDGAFFAVSVLICKY